MALREPPAAAANPRSGHAPRGRGVGSRQARALWFRGLGRVAATRVGSAWLFCAWGLWVFQGSLFSQVSGINSGFGPCFGRGRRAGSIVLWAPGVTRFGLCIWVLCWLAVLSAGLLICRSCCFAWSRAVVPACSTLSL